MIDVALYEAVFNCMESLLPEYSAFGAVREPAGSALPGIAPSNAYRCARRRYVLVAGNGDSIFKRLMEAIGRDDLAPTRRWRTTPAAWRAWTSSTPRSAPGPRTRSVDEVLDALDAAQVPAGRIYTAGHRRGPALPRARHARAQSRRATAATLDVPGIVPKLLGTPGSHPHRGAAIWARTPTRSCGEMGFSAQQIAALRGEETSVGIERERS